MHNGHSRDTGAFPTYDIRSIDGKNDIHTSHSITRLRRDAELRTSLKLNSPPSAGKASSWRKADRQTDGIGKKIRRGESRQQD